MFFSEFLFIIFRGAWGVLTPSQNCCKWYFTNCIRFVQGQPEWQYNVVFLCFMLSLICKNSATDSDFIFMCTIMESFHFLSYYQIHIQFFLRDAIIKEIFGFLQITFSPPPRPPPIVLECISLTNPDFKISPPHDFSGSNVFLHFTAQSRICILIKHIKCTCMIKIIL